MGGILSSPLFITIVGGALGSLAAALIAAYLLNRRPSSLNLYHKALREVCTQSKVSSDDAKVLRNALKDPVVVEAIESESIMPDVEADRLCEAIEHRTLFSSPLANKIWATTLVGHLLDTQYRIEGKYSHYSNRNQRRQSYFEKPPAPTGLTLTVASQQVTLTWNPVPHSGIWRYHIARSTNANASFTEVGTVPADTEPTLSFTDDEGLTNGTTYYYKVTAESKVLKQGTPTGPISAVPNVPATLALAIPSTGANPETSSTSVVSSRLFNLREDWRVIAEKCIDRKEDLKKLLAAFSNTSRRLILVEGFSGLGKTTLTARLALEVSSRYKVLWVTCHKENPVTAGRFLRDMGWFASDQCTYPLLSTIVGEPQHSQEEKDNGLLDFLAFQNSNHSLRPIAFFFDDYHWVKDPVLKRLVLKIAESHIDVKVVLVIRYLPPELQGEVDTASPIQLEGLESEGCRELIEMYATRYPALKDLDDERLHRIWKLTGRGVPKALEDFISMTHNLTLDDALEELPILTPATWKEWLDKAFYELSADEQQVAAEVSIFRRPTSRRALIAVSQCPRVKEVIGALVDRFVLTFDGRQYYMHALWSDYTAQCLSATEAKELHRRAARFYHDFMSQDRYTELMGRLESCFHFVKAGDMEQAERALMSIASTLRSWGFFQEFADSLVEIEKSAKEKGKPLASELSLEKMAMLYARGEVEQAIAILEELVSTNAGEIEIKALQELGWIYIETGERRKAERLLQRSKQLAHQQNLSKLEAEALHKLQHIAYHECNYDEALAYEQECLDILQHIKDEPEVREAIAWTYHELGNVYRERGFYKEALEFYQRDIPFWSERGNPPSRVGWITYDIGQIYRDQGKLREALKQFEDALQFFNKMQHLFGIAHVKIELGRIGAKVGPADPAIKLIEEAIDLLRKVKGLAGEAFALGALGQVYLSLNEPDIALQHLQKSLEMETDLHSIKGQAWLLHQISLAYEQQGKRLLLSGNYSEACSRFCEAQAAVAQAQILFAQIGAAPNIRGIQDDSIRIKQECTECTDTA